MRWDEEHESPDLIDRRGQAPAGGGIGALLPFLPFLLRSPLGWVVVVVVVGFVLVRNVVGVTAPRAHGANGEPAAAAGDENLVHFVSFVLDDVQATWSRALPAQAGVPYRHAKLVLFTDATTTGCGYGRSATGPFYCPADERVYIDLGFYRELDRRFGAPGQFAQAYVIAHEIGHHVQKILGTSERVARLRGSQEGANGASVRLELQADCYAGIWARSTDQRHLLEAGDLPSALRAAAAIGDDRLQRQATGAVSPETWTHGSSEERVRWLRRGYDTGRIDACDTFSASSL